MVSLIRSLNLKTALLVLPLLFVIGLGIFAAVAYYTDSEIRVLGPQYDEVVKNKDFAADVAPPPVNLLRAFLLAHTLPDVEPQERIKVMSDLTQTHREFDERTQFWLENMEEDHVRQLLRELDSQVGAFFEIIEKELIPAVERGDTEAIHLVLDQRLTTEYQKQHEVVTQLLGASKKLNEATEEAVRAKIGRSTMYLFFVGALVSLIVLFVSLGIRKVVVEQQVREQQAAAEVASMRERELEQAEILSQKVNKVVEAINAAARGDLTHSVTVSGSDSIGQVGSGLGIFLTDLRGRIVAITQNAKTLNLASEDLSAVSQQMSANANETSAQATTVSAAAEQVSMNVQTVAAATEEMSASIREIARSVAEATKVAREAVSIASTTNTTMSKLGESSAEIGDVIKVITAIAQQTKLLALNATIEAARAGEAGKGFAVVANAVKELAKETAVATEEIGHRIEAIQGDTTGAIGAIEKISSIIHQINEIQTTIATAVEEQTATANEMSRNISEGAKGTNEIARNITGVAKAAADTSTGAARSQQSAASLQKMATELEQLVARFTA